MPPDAENPGYLCEASPAELAAIRTVPGMTKKGPINAFVESCIEKGTWTVQCVRADVLGLARPLEILRAERKTTFIKPWKSDDNYCPAHWADLAIGSGACGLRCRRCFLILSLRAMRDPSRHLVYTNVDEYEKKVKRWLRKPNRRNLGVGIDCSDSLLYEGVTHHVRRLAPLFSSAKANPTSSKLLLLTKSTNDHFLAGLATENIVVSFSLNPEPIADLWEGKFPDGVRVTPPISARLASSLRTQQRGFEVRWRVDPILPITGWQRIYEDFFRQAASSGHRPTTVTLGTYREMGRQLGVFSSAWGLPPMAFQVPGLVRAGSHYHLPDKDRLLIYRTLRDQIKAAWKDPPVVALCKEPPALRRRLGLNHDRCNCH